MSRVRALRGLGWRRAVIAVALLGAGAASWRIAAGRDVAPTAIPSALADSSTTLACPVLLASGVDEPAGWLGAAAAATACERARVLLGGRPERTFVPAELLDLPRQPVDGFPADPYAARDARNRTLSAARSRAAAYLDGTVVARGAEFSVVLELHRADGSEFGHAQGTGHGLYAAVRAAMDPLVSRTMIPVVVTLDPDIAAWSGTHEVAAALALVDLTFALTHNAGGLPAECDRFQRTASARLGELGRFGQWQCDYTLGRPTPDVVLDGTDPSPGAVATRIRLRHILMHEDSPADASFLHELWQHEATSWGRSLAAVT
jgi:hypothetical protein